MSNKYMVWVYIIVSTPELHELHKYKLIPYLLGQTYPRNVPENASELVPHLALMEVADAINVYRALGVSEFTVGEFVSRLIGDDIKYVAGQ